MKEFRKMNPPSFDGLGDPVVAGHWLSQIRKIFDTVRITEDDMKVSFASYQLVGEANEWWESVKETKGVDHGMSWADFESTFEDQYFPEAYRDELREQFEKLVQGDMTVSDQRIRNFSDLLDCARRVEPKREQRKEFRGNWEPRQMSVGTSASTSGSFSKKRQRDSTQGSVGQQTVTSARSAHREYVIIVASKVTFLQIVRKGRILTVELGQCNSRVQDILLIISKGTNNRGTNLNSRVSQLLLSEDLEWREGCFYCIQAVFRTERGTCAESGSAGKGLCNY
ncbi:hypothetical protein Acr_24g0008280 [Actinidia rufa]|nr:hypothetical protein Acr_24g0008280 [Actinidia rufa]